MYKDFGLLISGKWQSASNQEVISVVSPVTEQLIGTIPAATRDDIERTLVNCQQAGVEWKKTSAWSRAAVLRRTADLIRSHVDEIAKIISTETGKPLVEAKAEAGASADQFEWYSEEGKRAYGQIIPARLPDERLSVIYQPVGPCLALSAWNFPLLLPARKIAAALAAGCPVISRPASEAPGSCFALGQVLIDAGLPAGVFSILTGDPNPMVRDLISSPIIRKVSLTGSVPIGKEILRQCAEGIKKVTMELGGHAPVIVYPDFDPISAAKKLATTKFRNCGQVCISPSRFYVHRSIIKPFAEAFVEVAKNLKTGSGLDEGVTTGPLIREKSLKNALSLIADAQVKGAELLLGGNRDTSHKTGYFLEPTVLANVPSNARIMIEEPFAPVAPVASFDRFEEAIKLANSTPFGLASYVFTHDSTLAEQTTQALESGMVGINETLLGTAEAPFGGIKESGFGREGGSLGIFDYLVPKYIRHHLAKGSVDV